MTNEDMDSLIRGFLHGLLEDDIFSDTFDQEMIEDVMSGMFCNTEDEEE